MPSFRVATFIVWPWPGKIENEMSAYNLIVALILHQDPLARGSQMDVGSRICDFDLRVRIEDAASVEFG